MHFLSRNWPNWVFKRKKRKFHRASHGKYQKIRGRKRAQRDKRLRTYKRLQIGDPNIYGVLLLFIRSIPLQWYFALTDFKHRGFDPYERERDKKRMPWIHVFFSPSRSLVNLSRHNFSGVKSNQKWWALLEQDEFLTHCSILMQIQSVLPDFFSFPILLI